MDDAYDPRDYEEPAEPDFCLGPHCVPVYDAAGKQTGTEATWSCVDCRGCG